MVLLVDEGASAIMTDNDNQTPKDAAASEGHIDIVTYLRVMGEFVVVLVIRKFFWGGRCSYMGR